MTTAATIVRTTTTTDNTGLTIILRYYNNNTVQVAAYVCGEFVAAVLVKGQSERTLATAVKKVTRTAND